MKNYLPVVNPDVGCSLARNLLNRDDDDYVEDELEKIEKENPAVAVWINKFSSQTGDPIGSKFCAVLVYNMLRSQAEADDMKETLKLG